MYILHYSKILEDTSTKASERIKGYSRTIRPFLLTDVHYEQAAKNAADNAHKSRRLAEDSGSLDAGILKLLYVKFIASCNFPLRLV